MDYLEKKPPKWLYRLESLTKDNGLWYDDDNNYVWGIGTLENCQTKNLPMGFDPRYHKNNKCWHSSCSNIRDLAHWYSLEDAQSLIQNGFGFYKYLATEYEEYENETTFIKATCLDKVELEIDEIWNENHRN